MEYFKHFNLLYLKHIRNLSHLGNEESNGTKQINAHVNGFNNNYSRGNSRNFNNGVFSRSQTTMHLGHFKEIQSSYAMKAFFFLRDVYYRGVVLILKKNKFFKAKADGEGKWTFKGYLKKPAQACFNYANRKSINFNLNSNNSTTFDNNPNNLSDENHYNYNINNHSNDFNSRPTSPLSPILKSGAFTSNANKNKKINSDNSKNNFKYESDFFGMDIFDKIEDFWANFFIDDFPDIRLTHSYFLFLAKSNKKNIDLSKYIYDQYDDSSKLKLNNSITTFVTLFFRQCIEKSVEELVNFILNFKLVDELVTNLNQQFLLNNPNYNFEQNTAGKLNAVKENNHLSVIKKLKESNGAHGNGSNNSSNRNILNVNLNNFNNNLNTINEIEKLEKSFKDTDDYVTSSENFLGDISPINNHNNNFNNNKNLNSKNNLNLNSDFNSLNFNAINKDTSTIEPMLSGKNKNQKQIHLREASRDITVKSADTTRTKDYNYTNLNNHLLFPHYDINAYISYKENDIKLPIIKSFVVSDILNPVIHISTKIDSIYNLVKLEYSYDQVSEIFIKICDNIISLFNGLYTTHFMDFKTVLPPDVERIQKAHWLRINEVFSDKLDTSYKDYYSNISPNLIIDTEKFSEGNFNSNADDMSEIYNFFSMHIRNNFLKPALITEEIFVNYRNVIATNIKDHMLEMEEVLKLFQPIKDLINHSFAELVNNFKENFGTIPEYNKFTFFIEKIRTYIRYVTTIPDFVGIFLIFSL
jgi:hypothetical protein